jgi:7-cyano-7-deazaguanine synthase
MLRTRNVIKTVVLLSGGLDSAVCLGLALAAQRDVTPLFIEYKQRSTRELDHAVKLLTYYKRPGLRPLEKARFSLPGIKSRLTDENSELTASIEDPLAYVPSRNAIMISLAYALAESIGATEVWIGTTYARLRTDDMSDASPEFLKAIDLALLLGSRCGATLPISLIAPLQDMQKTDVIREAQRIKTPFHLTWSCQDRKEDPCGVCSSCRARREAFAELGLSVEPGLKAW